MQVVKNLSIEIPGTNTHFFDLEEYSDKTSKNALFLGYSFLERSSARETAKPFDKTAYLNVTMPTEFCSNQDINADDCFNYIFSICPYSSLWLNEIKSANKYKSIWYPFSANHIPSIEKKEFDVCYHGGIHGDKYVRMLNIIRKFNYRYLSMTNGINHTTSQNLKFATNLDLSNKDKLSVVAKTKISICFNNFPVRGSSDVYNIKSKPFWYKNEAFSSIEKDFICPQVKSRFFEACLSRTLNLVERDQWNVIENWFDPAQHFVYFNGIDDLESKIEDILDNYDSYSIIIDNAYNKCASEYLTSHLVSKIKKEFHEL